MIMSKYPLEVYLKQLFPPNIYSSESLLHFNSKHQDIPSIMSSTLVLNHLLDIHKSLSVSSSEVIVNSKLLDNYQLGLTQVSIDDKDGEITSIVKLLFAIVSSNNFLRCQNYESLINLLSSILLRLKFSDIVSFFNDASYNEISNDNAFFEIFKLCVESPLHEIQKIPFEILLKTTQREDLLDLDRKIIDLIFASYIDINIPLSVVNIIDTFFKHLLALSNEKDLVDLYFQNEHITYLIEHCYINNHLNLTLQLRVLDLLIMLILDGKVQLENIKVFPHLLHESHPSIDYYFYLNKYLEFLASVVKHPSTNKILHIFVNDFKMISNYFTSWKDDAEFENLSMNEFFLFFHTVSFEHYAFFVKSNILPIDLFDNLYDSVTMRLLACINPKYFHKFQILKSSYLANFQISNKKYFDILCNFIQDNEIFASLTNKNILTVKNIKTNLTLENALLLIGELSKYQLSYLIYNLDPLIHEYLLDDNVDASDLQAVAISKNFKYNQLKLQIVEELLIELKSHSEIKSEIINDLIVQREKLTNGDVYSSSNFTDATQGLIETKYL